MIKKFLRSRGEKKTHEARLGEGGLSFLNQRYSLPKDELIIFEAKNYKNKFHLRNKTSDLPTFYQCIFDQEYDIKFNKSPEVMVDLGANIGLTSVFFKSKYPKAKIISVEPESSNFEVMSKNFIGLDNMVPIQSAVWHSSVDLEIEDNGSGHYGYNVKEVPTPTETSFKAIGIEDLMKVHNIHFIDVLKIDIEGAEKELFSENYEYWLSRVGTLIVETHDRFKTGSAKSVFKALSNYDYDFEMKGENVIFHLKNQG